MLKYIIPLLPSDIHNFVDLFGGGFNVGINVNADCVLYNDNNKCVVEMLQYFKDTPTDKLLSEIQCIIDKYKLDKENQEGYLQLRNYYNHYDRHPCLLYAIICYSFDNRMRFNSKNEFNMSFGKDRSSFNDALKDRFIKFVDCLHSKNCKFINKDYLDFSFEELTENDFVYCDPPYLSSVVTYSKGGGMADRR